MKRLYTYIFILLGVTLACMSCAEEALPNGDTPTELLEVPEEAIVVDSSKGTQSVTILSRYDFKAEEDADWLVCSKLDHRTLQLNFDENRTTDEREATIVITITDEFFGVSYSKTFQVKQRGAQPTVYAYILSESLLGGFDKVNEYYVWQSSGDEVKMYVESNTEYTISSDCDWITWSEPTSESNEDRDVILLSVGCNETISEEYRVGHIHVTAEGAKSTFTIYQAPFSPYLILDYEHQNGVRLSSNLSNYTIKFSVNTSWKASCDADWITLSPTSEIFDNQGEHKECEIRLSAQANTRGGERSATITIESIESSYQLKQTVAITQEGMFTVTGIQSRYMYMGNSYSFTLNAERDWVITSDASASWLGIVAQGGVAGSSDISFVVEDNNSEQERTAVVTISAADNSDLKATFTITQDHINTIYYYSRYKQTSVVDKILYNIEVAEHLFDNGIGRVIFNETVTSLEAKEISYSSTWGSTTTKVVLPPTITTIGKRAFYYNYGFTRIDLPKSVTSIAEEAITQCALVTEIYCEAANPPAGATGMFKLNEDCKIYVPMDSVEAYKNAPYWSDYAERIVGF